MLSKPHRPTYSTDLLNLASRLRAFKSPNLSRLFPLLSSLKYSKQPKSQWTREFRGNPGEKEFVVLILICYKGWKRRTHFGELEDLELKAVRNDARLLLDYLNYRHDDKSRNWYFVMDFDLEYTDRTGITKILPRTMPSKNALLRTVREATRKGGSGFIHVGAHCHYDNFGTSYSKTEGRTVIFEETPHEQTGTKPAYFISSDGQQVFGKEFHLSLSDDSDLGCDATLTLSLDMCHAGAFFQEVVNLPCLTTTSSTAASQIVAVEQRRSRKQLVLISSSQAGQTAGALYDRAGDQGLFGASTSLLIESLKKSPLGSPAEVVKYLNDVCSKRLEEHLRQSPSIASRYPIRGPLRLLPGPTAAL
ncbi:hypothetical protein FS837_012974 [Tulasnella sp. UAMH 9824]|nr:hypothetical protein FS837_012974 [Tulasnella sp. UAMH 9824]